MALLRDYELLIADEPFNGLDPKQIINFKKLLLEEKTQGKLVLLLTHLLDMVDDICDAYIILHQGECLVCSNYEKLI
jgi:ABC-2 type transport system ATP-binding protein